MHLGVDWGVPAHCSRRSVRAREAPELAVGGRPPLKRFLERKQPPRSIHSCWRRTGNTVALCAGVVHREAIVAPALHSHADESAIGVATERRRARVDRIEGAAPTAARRTTSAMHRASTRSHAATHVMRWCAPHASMHTVCCYSRVCTERAPAKLLPQVAHGSATTFQREARSTRRSCSVLDVDHNAAKALRNARERSPWWLCARSESVSASCAGVNDMRQVGTMLSSTHAAAPTRCRPLQASS